MTDTTTIVRTTEGSLTAEFVAALDALRDCADASTTCASAMVTEGGMAAEVRLALDCADVTGAAARVLARGPAGDPTTLRAVVTAAQAAADASARACGEHADHHLHCRLHAASATACADALRTLTAQLS